MHNSLAHNHVRVLTRCCSLAEACCASGASGDASDQLAALSLQRGTCSIGKHTYPYLAASITSCQIVCNR